MLADLIKSNRSCRRFYQNQPVDPQTLEDLVDLARLSASAANLQPLRYIICTEAGKNADIFDCLSWAGYLKDWPGPAQGERPAAYIIILGDTRIAKNVGCDHGIAAQSILLGAREKGLAGCMIGSIRRDRLRRVFRIQQHYQVLLVLALGRPKEAVRIVPLPSDGNVQYWRDEYDVHHVPKRGLQDIILATYSINTEADSTNI